MFSNYKDDYERALTDLSFSLGIYPRLFNRTISTNIDIIQITQTFRPTFKRNYQNSLIESNSTENLEFIQNMFLPKYYNPFDQRFLGIKNKPFPYLRDNRPIFNGSVSVTSNETNINKSGRISYTREINIHWVEFNSILNSNLEVTQF